MFERLRRVRRGVRGGWSPPDGGLGATPPNFFFWADIFSPVSGRHIIVGLTYLWDHMILGGFRHMVFADGFLFPVKELGFWTNPGHWVRVLDAVGSYMYILL